MARLAVRNAAIPAFLLFLCGTIFAQEDMAQMEPAADDAKSYCDVCCASGGGWFGGVEFQFMKFHESGHGVRNSDAPDPGDSADFDFNFTPRFTAGYQACDGLGLRANYWYYDDTAATNDGGFLHIRAYYIDVEAFQTVDLTECVGIEVFGGLRYSEFRQNDDTTLHYGVDGVGLTAGASAYRQLCNGALYVRGRTSFLMGDGELSDSGNLDEGPMSFVDQVVMQTELAAGWNGCRCMNNGSRLTYGVGVEYQMWSDTVIAGDESLEANFYDAAWAGFVARVGVEY